MKSTFYAFYRIWPRCLNGMLAVLALSICMFSCIERIQLDDTDSGNTGVELRVVQAADSSITLQWNQVYTTRFVKYVLLRSSSPIPDQVQVPILGVHPIRVVGEFTDAKQVKAPVIFGFDSEPTHYYRLLVVLTDRQALSNEITLPTKTLRVDFPFNFTKTLVSADRNYMYVYWDQNDSIYLIDLQTFKVKSQVFYPKSFQAWCIGDYGGKINLFVKTSTDITRFSGLDMQALTATISIPSGISSMVFVRDEVVGFMPNTSPRKVAVISADHLLLSSVFSIPGTFSVQSNTHMYCIDPARKKFVIGTFNRALLLSIGSDHVVQLDKTQVLPTSSAAQIKNIEAVSTPFVLVNTDIYIDSALSKAVDLQTLNSFGAKTQIASDSEFFLISSFTQGSATSQSMFKIDKGKFATGAVIPPSTFSPNNGNITDGFLYEKGTKLHWVFSTPGASSFSILMSRG
jgi:hypothetical protein